MKELVLSDPERRLLSECVFVVFRLSLQGFLSDLFPAEKLHDLCLKVGGVDFDAINDLFEACKVRNGNKRI